MSKGLPSGGKRTRWKINAAQRRVLHHAFAQNAFPDLETRRTLAEALGATPRQVQVWFQNHRERGLLLHEHLPHDKEIFPETEVLTVAPVPPPVLAAPVHAHILPDLLATEAHSKNVSADPVDVMLVAMSLVRVLPQMLPNDSLRFARGLLEALPHDGARAIAGMALLSMAMERCVHEVDDYAGAVGREMRRILVDLM